MAEGADQAVDNGASGQKGASIIDFLLMAIVGVVCGLGGVMVPRFFGSAEAAQVETEQVEEAAEKEETDEPETVYVPFGDVVVNLNEPRLNRYMRVNISLEVRADDAAEVTQLVEQKKPLLKNWLIAYLSDKQLEEVRGAAALNRLSREIRDAFNRILVGDEEKILGVLFEEFNIQ